MKNFENLKNKFSDTIFEPVEDNQVPTEETQTFEEPQEEQHIHVEPQSVQDEVYVPKKPTIISTETTIHGNVEADNDLEISGKVIGDINTNGIVKITSGYVAGNINAVNVYIYNSSVDGYIECRETLEIVADSHIKGNLRGSNITIDSECFGNIYAKEHLELQSHAIVRGDISTKTIQIQRGAFIQGYLSMDEFNHGGYQEEYHHNEGYNY